MDFDINQLEKRDDWDEDQLWEEFNQYSRKLCELFADSPEGQKYLSNFPEDEFFWCFCLMEYGFNYCEVSLPEMHIDDIEEIIEELFPQKISIQSEKELDSAIPSLIAFWSFIQREFQLKNAASILRYLAKAEPTFRKEMNDPHNFGMGKSVLSAGREAGFDMTNEEEMNAFMHVINAQGGLDVLPHVEREHIHGPHCNHDQNEDHEEKRLKLQFTKKPQDKAKLKKRKKMAGASRKKNKKKKK